MFIYARVVHTVSVFDLEPTVEARVVDRAIAHTAHTPTNY